MIIGRQFAPGVQSDFVQHSAKIEKATHFLGWTAQGNRSHQNAVWAFSRLIQVSECFGGTGRMPVLPGAAFFI